MILSHTLTKYIFYSVNCPVGSYYDDTSSSCAQCPAGTYSNAEAQTSCTSCPGGQTTAGVGANSEDDCYGK